jgi:hypothetical protein
MGSQRFVTKLSENAATGKPVEILRVGKLQDRDLEITKDMLTEMVKNFKKDVYGQEIPVNLDHYGGESMGWFKECYLEDDSLMAVIEWTESGKEKIEKKLYKYVSIEYSPTLKAKNNKFYSNVIVGLALTNWPAMKEQKPVELKEKNHINNNLTKISMDTIKKMLASLALKTMLSEDAFEAVEIALSEHEGEEGHKEALAELEALKEKCAKAKKKKMEDDMEDDEEEMSKKKMKKKDKEMMAENTDVIKLSEELKKERQEKVALAERVHRLELKEKTDKLTVSLSEAILITEDKPVGLNQEKLEELVAFAIELSDDQATKLVNLLSEVKTISLGEAGSTNERTHLGNSEVDNKIKLAEEEAGKTAKETGRPLSECLAEAFRKHNIEA